MSGQYKAEVVIVGAGLSGLMAADHLQKTERDVVILEARERIGGRIHTVTTDDGRGAFDLGPAWFWSHNRYVIELLNATGLRYFEQYESGDNLFQQQGQSPERFRQQWQTPTSYRIEGGTIALANALHDRLQPETIRLAHVVKSITAQDDDTLQIEVQVDDATQVWQAQQVIITLPPHLAATTIDYRPALPQDVKRAMQTTPTWMGEAMKVTLVYERPFWRDRNLSGMAVSYFGAVQQWQDATPADQSTGAIFGWIGNNSRSRTLSPQARREAVIKQAVELFGDEAATPLHYDEVNWEHESFTSNPDDPARVVASDHPQYGHPLLQEPQMNGRLWWATTEVSPVNGGYLDGALYIAQAVAEKIGEAQHSTASVNLRDD